MNTQSLSFTAEHGGITTEHFRSLCESTVVCLEGIAEPNAKLSYTLLAIDPDGARSVIYQKPIATDDKHSFRFSHEFDPVSLAVYQNAVDFFVRVDGACQTLSVTVTENEQIACQLQTAKAKRKARPREKKPLRNVLFIGNSILLGMENHYGMCASSPKHDYAYHVSEEIKKSNPDCRFFKLHGSCIEHAESTEEFEDVFYCLPNLYTNKPVCESLTPDLDLVILQITDNVNTEKKLETFTHTAELLLSRIQERCPNAVIVWVYGWFHKSAFFPRLLELCEQYGVEQVDVRGCRCQANEAASGYLYLSADGTQKVVRDTWITHPGDGGMKAVADQIIATLREASIL